MKLIPIALVSIDDLQRLARALAGGPQRRRAAKPAPDLGERAAEMRGIASLAEARARADTKEYLAGIREHVGVRGEYVLELYGPDGKLKDRRVAQNLVVNAGKNWIREFGFDAVTPTAIARMGWTEIGTGANAPAAGDVALQTPAVRLAFDNPGGYVAGGTGVVTVKTTFPAGTGPFAITEAGLFNAAAAGTMWNRVTFAAVNKANGDTLVVSTTITFA